MTQKGAADRSPAAQHVVPRAAGMLISPPRYPCSLMKVVIKGFIFSSPTQIGSQPLV